MTGVRKRLTLAAICLIVAPAPALICLPYLQHKAEETAIAEAALLAQRALARNEAVTDQVAAALTTLQGLQLSNPCGPEGLVAMQGLALTHHHLQAIGHIHDDRFTCSSAGSLLDGIDVGRPEFSTQAGAEVRTRRRLPFASQSFYRITAAVKTGFAVVLHDNSSFDGTDSTSGVVTGLVNFASHQLMTHSEAWRADWARHLGQQTTAGFVDGDRVVALRRSQKYEYYVFASLPASAVSAHLRSLHRIVLPLAALSGLLAALGLLGLIRRRSSLTAQLESALADHKQLFVVYQPIVDLTTLRWVGAEVLLRWRTPGGELISPAIFVPLAAERGLMRRLTAKMLATVRSEVGHALGGIDNFYLSVNLGAEDLEDSDVTTLLTETVRVLGGEQSRLRVEVTEHSLLDAKRVGQRIAELRELGIAVAIDDFGTGYSSLSYLTELRVDGLKIDKSFVDTVGKSAASSGVIPHIIEMAHSLGLYIVAEGIEQKLQADYLRERGVRFGQGWLYARAIPFQELLEGLRSQGALGRAAERPS